MLYLRLKKNTDFQKLFKRGKKVFSPYVTVLYYPSRATKMGIALSKKHGKAVVRNRIKRLIRAAFASCAGDLASHYDLVIIPKACDDYSYKNFEKSLQSCIRKINSCQS